MNTVSVKFLGEIVMLNFVNFVYLFIFRTALSTVDIRVGNIKI